MQAATASALDGWSDYWRQSRRPLVSLVFVAPLLLAYEAGVLWIGPRAMRNGADIWLRDWLEWLGFGQYLLLPLATCAVLLAWHHVLREPWTFRGSLLVTMLLECTLLAVLLLIVARLQGRLFADPDPSGQLAAGGAGPGTLPRLVAYCGAGIYEELLFRLLALPAVACGLRGLGLPRGGALLTAVISTSLLFALAHYSLVSVHGEDFHWFSFTFRTLAGSFFALLFITRGFGIAVGAHAGYDMLLTLL
ncbi:MAG: CPBP family intramembrane metalloprotease [Pirellulaceae bacterium]|nr:CPBP family intramembrane metalloprotease [Pirellulaceae bacterium]